MIRFISVHHYRGVIDAGTRHGWPPYVPPDVVCDQGYIEEKGEPAPWQQENHWEAQMEEVLWKDQLKRVEG